VIELPSAGPHMSGGSMKPQNEHEHVLVVGQIRHRFDILVEFLDMSMLAKNHAQTQL
jgi:hypothetical protein